MSTQNKKHLHCLGIGGIGVSAIARHYLSLGWDVSGCDPGGATPISGVTIAPVHNPEHLDDIHLDIVVYSPAVSLEQPELLRARERGIPTYSYPEALGQIAKEKDTIAVSGTHGKSTSTALLSLMFVEGGKDPLAIVGARVPLFELNDRAGQGKTFIVEGCEYRRSMLAIHPRHILLTNIEADHLDYYKDIDDVCSAFEEYVKGLPHDGILVYNADDEYSRRVARASSGKSASFALHSPADLVGESYAESEKGITFALRYHGEVLGTITSPLSGAYNAMNILGASLMALEHGISFSAIARAVEKFSGIGRRGELIGTYHGVPVYSDYAHHPTALRAISEAMTKKYADGRVLVIFQPHQVDRTKKLAHEFVDAFCSIPDLLLTEIYQVKGREEAGVYSVETLVTEANVGRTSPPILFAKALSDIERILAKSTEKYSAIVFVGAGDIDGYARSIVTVTPK